MNKPANTSLNIMDEIKERWSPRAFSTKVVEPEKLEKIFEAAHWSASCFNEQPWRFLVGIRNQDAAWQKIFDCLADGNQIWCKPAPVLALLIYKKTFTHNNRTNSWAAYDLGQSAAYICIQAAAEDLYVHQMAGFDPEKARKAFNIPDEFEIKTAMAIGYYGDADALPDELKKSELGPRSRKKLSDLVFSGEWEKMAEFIKS